MSSASPKRFRKDLLGSLSSPNPGPSIDNKNFLLFWEPAVLSWDWIILYLTLALSCSKISLHLTFEIPNQSKRKEIICKDYLLKVLLVELKLSLVPKFSYFRQLSRLFLSMNFVIRKLYCFIYTESRCADISKKCKLVQVVYIYAAERSH